MRRRSPPESAIDGRLAQPRDVEFLEQLVELGLALLLVRLDHFEHRADVVLDVEPAEDRGLLRQIADAEARALIHRQVRDVVAVELDAAVVGLDQPGDHVEHRGLAGAVRPEQADRLAAPHVQAHALHDLAAAEAFLDAVDRERTGCADDRREPPARAATAGTRARADATARCLRRPLEHGAAAARSLVAVEAVRRSGSKRIAPQVGRRDRLPVEVALCRCGRSAARTTRLPLPSDMRSVVVKFIFSVWPLAIGSATGPRSMRQSDGCDAGGRGRSAPEWLENIQHAASRLPKNPQP